MSDLAMWRPRWSGDGGRRTIAVTGDTYHQRGGNMRLKHKLAAITVATGIGLGGAAIVASPVDAAPVHATATVAAPAAPVPRHGDSCTNAPDSGPTWNFHEACHWHDWCYGAKPYGNSQWGRLQCDARFWDRMISSCNSRYSWYDPRRYTCREVAGIYFRVVVAAGWAYWD
jgi:hypothetical protein